MDKIYIAQSWLGELSTAPWGVIKFADGKFTLDKAAWYNKLQPGAHKGDNVCRVLSISLFGNQTHATVFQPFALSGVLWDLGNYNDYYFPIMKEAIAIAKSLGVKIWFELFDHCGLWYEVKHLNPWANNIQGYSSFYWPSGFVNQYVNRMLSEFGDTVLWGLGNELSNEVGLLWNSQHSAVTGTVMFKSILPIFKEHGIVPFGYGADLDIYGEEHHCSVRKAQSLDVEAVFSEHEKIQLFHCCHKACDWTNERVVKPMTWWHYHSIAFSDDGAFPRPDGDQWAQTINFVLKNQNIEVPQFGQAGKARLLFEHCPEAPDSEQVIEKMVTACEAHGVTFENKGKYPDDWEEPKIPKPPALVESKPKITWQGWIGLAVIALAVIVILILVL